MRGTRAGTDSWAAGEEHIGKTWEAKDNPNLVTGKSVGSQERGWEDGSQRFESAKDEAISKSVSSTDVQDNELSPSAPLHAAQ